jgi:hypothetical protein
MTQTSNSADYGLPTYKGRPYRVAFEIFALATFAWVASLIAQDDPSHGANVSHFGAKWIAYTYTMATMLSVLLPAFVVSAAVTVFCVLRWRRPSSVWTVYRVGLVLAVIWTIVSNYGLWYGSCRQQHSVEYCSTW